jgi:hypothetical protein
MEAGDGSNIKSKQTPHNKYQFEIVDTKKYKPYFGHLYGIDGIGKTSLAASIPYSVVIDIEGGAGGLGVTHLPFQHEKTPAETLNKLLWAIQFAIDSVGPDGNPYGTVIIDSVSMMQQLVVQDYLLRSGKDKVTTGEYGKSYDQIKDMFIKFLGFKTGGGIIHRVLSSGRNLILIGHDKDKTLSMGDSKLFIGMIPGLYEGVDKHISQNADWVFYYCYDMLVTEESEGFKKEKKARTRGRKLITRLDGGMKAKSRYKDIPPIINNPTFEPFLDMYDHTKDPESLLVFK